MDGTLLQKFMQDNKLRLFDIYLMYCDLKLKDSNRQHDEFIAAYKDYIGKCFMLPADDDDDDDRYVKIIGVDKDSFRFIGICCYGFYWFTKTNNGLDEYEPIWEDKFEPSCLTKAREISADEYSSTIRRVMDSFLSKNWREEI